MDEELFRKAKRCWIRFSQVQSMMKKTSAYGDCLLDLIDNQDIEIPRYGELSQDEREMWEELARIKDLERSAQIELFVNFVESQVPSGFYETI